MHDLRWVTTYHDSWLSLGLELAVILALRMLQLRCLAKRPPVVERRRRGCPPRRKPHLREMS